MPFKPTTSYPGKDPRVFTHLPQKAFTRTFPRHVLDNAVCAEDLFPHLFNWLTDMGPRRHPLARLNTCRRPSLVVSGEFPAKAAASFPAVSFPWSPCLKRGRWTGTSPPVCAAPCNICWGVGNILSSSLIFYLLVRILAEREDSLPELAL